MCNEKPHFCNISSSICIHSVKSCVSATTYLNCTITSVPFMLGLFYNTDYIVLPFLFSCGGAGPFWLMCDRCTLNALNLAACTSRPASNAHTNWFPDGKRHTSVGPALCSPLEHCSQASQLPTPFTIHPEISQLYIRIFTAH